MSYEMKDEIIEDVKAHCKTKNKNIAVYPVYHYEDKVEEIHIVYAQAAKADEYEAKAEAFDAICKAYEPLENIDKGLDFAVETEKIILKFYESGEPNAKK